MKNISENEYYSIPYYSASVINAYERNPSVVKLCNDPNNPFALIEKEENKSMLFGKLIHKAITESEEFRKMEPIYMSMLTKSEQKIFSNCLQGARANQTFKKLLEKAKHIEQSVIWNHSFDGEKATLKCKGRIDMYSQGMLVDVKTTRRTLEKFKYAVDEYRTDLQMAFYKEGLEKNGLEVAHVLLFVIEKVPPYGSHLFLMNDGLIDRGRLGNGKYRGYENILKEMHFHPRERFAAPITDLIEDE